jgi:hypothetical protein
MSEAFGWSCGSCGKRHDELPLSYRTHAPVYWSEQVSQDENSDLTADLCVIQGEHFFVQGNIEIPVIDSDQVFVWGVWVSLSHANFSRTLDLWDQDGRENEPSYFGWLSTELADAYGRTTVQLKTQVHTRSVGSKPVVEVEPTGHPLAVEQRAGITMARVQQLAEQVMHGPDGV